MSHTAANTLNVNINININIYIEMYIYIITDGGHFNNIFECTLLNINTLYPFKALTFPRYNLLLKKEKMDILQ